MNVIYTDADRMDWLDAQFKVVTIGKNKDGAGAVQWLTNLGHWSDGWRGVRSHDLRTAIDAAMSADAGAAI